MSKRAVLYARVSTDEQADKGYSLPSQLDLCRKYAERLGFGVVTELTEEHSGATPIAERPKGKELAAMLKARKANAVIVYRVDRLSRDIVDLLTSVRDWLRMGVEVHTCDIGKVGSELDIVLVIKGWQGSNERVDIRERTMRGINRKAREGKVIGGGKSPYGYQFAHDDSKRVMGLAIVDAEGNVIRLIYRWYVYGDENGEPMTAWAIARRLSEMRVPTPDRRKLDETKHKGRPARNANSQSSRIREAHLWNEVTVNCILQNETYAGVWHYGKRIGKNGKGGKRPVGEQITVNVPAIIDRSLWQAAQDRRAHNKRMSRRNCQHNYLLRGMVTCGECGGAVSGGSTKPDSLTYFYYRCTRRHFEGLEDKRCHQKVIRTECLESVVWDYILGLWSNKRRFEKALHNAQKAERDATQPIRERLAAIDELIANCLNEADDLAHAMKKARGLVSDKLQRDMDEVNARHEVLAKERDELTAKLNAQTLGDTEINELLKSREDTVIGLHAATPEDKRRDLEHLRTEVTVKDENVWVKTRVSVSVALRIDKSIPSVACARSG